MMNISFFMFVRQVGVSSDIVLGYIFKCYFCWSSCILVFIWSNLISSKILRRLSIRQQLFWFQYKKWKKYPLYRRKHPRATVLRFPVTQRHRILSRVRTKLPGAISDLQRDQVDLTELTTKRKLLLILFLQRFTTLRAKLLLSNICQCL